MLMCFKNYILLFILFLSYSCFYPLNAFPLHEPYGNVTMKMKGTDTMNYHEWVRLLGEAIRLINKVSFNNLATIELEWSGNVKLFAFADNDSAAMGVNIYLKKNHRLLVTYTIVPWQNFSRRTKTDNPAEPGHFEHLLTVTEYAVIYTLSSTTHLNTEENEVMEKFDTAFNKVIDYENNQTVVEEEDSDIPSGIQIISGNVFKNYIDLQVAVPGSRLPEFTRWGKVSNSRMLHLSLVPDRGEIKSSWIKPAEPKLGPYYTSVERDLLKHFAGAIEKCIENPENRGHVFNETRNSMRSLFSAANSVVNFLFHEYETKLSRWLCLPEGWDNLSDMERLFPDYEPKRTPDTVIDFRPQLAEDVYRIPEAKLDNFIELLHLLIDTQGRAKKNPGQWVDGHVPLGARPREYEPSSDELLASEIGDRLHTIIQSEPEEQIRNLLQKEKMKIEQLEYTRFTFIHMDVMGSGRFFYVDTIEKVMLHFR